MARRTDTITIENARIVFRNFAGVKKQYNNEGDRNFAVILDNASAERLIDEGWNVKTLKPREEGDEPKPYIKVAVSYLNKPPRVVMITSRNRTQLDEASVEMLDFVDIKNADLIIAPFHWSVNGNSGVKAYLQSLYITIDEDELEIKYSQDPE